MADKPKTAPAKQASPAASASKPQAATKKEGTVVPVPETVLKRRRTRKEILERRQTQALKKSVHFRESNKVIVRRAEKYINEYRAMRRSEIFMRRQAKDANNFFIPPQPKLLLIVRLAGINNMAPKPRKVLQLLRLRQINNACFVRVNKSTLNMVKLIEPYVAYGYPSVRTVKQLVYKRGFAKIGGARVTLNDNSLIEKYLSKYGILCMEDIVHELYTVGPHFKQVNAFLWTFKLSNPTGGFRNKKTHYIEGGDCGNREGKINELAARMN